MELLDPDRQSTGTAGQVENPLMGFKVRLLDQRHLERFLARCRANYYTVGRRQPTEAQSGYETRIGVPRHVFPLEPTLTGAHGERVALPVGRILPDFAEA